MSRKDTEMSGQLMAINNSMATIEFALEGTIVSANDKFLHAMGYSLEEVKGRHHRMFVDPAYAASEEYRTFWKKLNAGFSQNGEFRRIGKGNREVWISASYTVVTNKHGQPEKVIKFAHDITDQKMRSLDFEGQINAVNNTMASIEFNLDGIIVNANDKFLEAMGYHRDEIFGKHHRIFVAADQIQSAAYASFWSKLKNGQAQTGEFKRLGKNGKIVWINANYTPIKDADGRIYKVVKFAQDITTEKLKAVDFEGQIQAIRRSSAVIEFDLEGKILFANDIFISAMGYKSPEEVVGKHHRIFVSEFEVNSTDYKTFWETLSRGEFFKGEFKRKKADGSSIWINGSYNPIINAEGKPYKVVKYAQVINKAEAAAGVPVNAML